MLVSFKSTTWVKLQLIKENPLFVYAKCITQVFLSCHRPRLAAIVLVRTRR